MILSHFNIVLSALSSNPFGNHWINKTIRKRNFSRVHSSATTLNFENPEIEEMMNFADSKIEEMTKWSYYKIEEMTRTIGGGYLYAVSKKSLRPFA